MNIKSLHPPYLSKIRLVISFLLSIISYLELTYSVVVSGTLKRPINKLRLNPTFTFKKPVKPF